MCTYCYFFEGGDDSWKKHTPIIKYCTLEKLCDFITEGIKEFKFENVFIILHGGEPLLMKKPDFRNMCILFREKIKDTTLHLSIQTNGVLLDEEWIEIFNECNVGVGVSMDGTIEAHNKYRIDRKGRGSYKKARTGIDLLKKNKIDFGILAVIDSNSKGVDIYNHFINDIQCKRFDLLLPDNHYENPHENPDCIGDILCEVFECWIKDNNPEIKIRILSTIMDSLLGNEVRLLGFGANLKDSVIFSISSDGDLIPDDVLKSSKAEIMDAKGTLFDTSMADFLDQAIFKEFWRSKTHLPKDCKDCTWQNICAGGSLINRFSKENGFDNPSIYCNSLQKIYMTVTSYLINNGIEKQQIQKILLAA